MGHSPRTLDVELRGHCRDMNPDFDFKKLAFVVEAREALHNEQLEMAQSRTASALKKSLASAWELFRTNLESDQVQRAKYLQSCSGDESRQRAAILDSLEVELGKHGLEPNIQTIIVSSRPFRLRF